MIIRIAIWLTAVVGMFAIAVLMEAVPLTGVMLAVLALCCVCELVDSSLGMGFGTSLTPILLFAGFEDRDPRAAGLVAQLVVSIPRMERSSCPDPREIVSRCT